MEPRVRRAMAAVGLALAAVLVIGAIYLRPWQVPPTTPARAPVPRLADGPESVLQAQFLSTGVGWVVTGGTVYATLFHTADGGRHWQHQLDAASGSNGWGLWFFDGRRGVVYGADLHGTAMWRTTDGGQHWTRLETPCQTVPSLIFFLDPGHGWCVNVAGTLTPNMPFDDRREIALLRTTDGGVHWSTVLTTTIEQPVVNGLGDDGQKSWIGFRDARIGWIGQSTRGSSAVVYSTTDGGDLWNRQVLPPPRDGWARAQSTWEVSPRETGGPLSAPALVAGAYIPGPKAPSVVVGDQYLYRWRGSTWSGPVPVPARVVSVIGESHWWVANGSALLETTDGGEDWHQAGETPAGWLIDRLTLVDPGHGWALAFRPIRPAFSAVLRSDDGGRDWTPITIPA